MSVHCEKCGQANYLPSMVKRITNENAEIYEALRTTVLWAESMYGRLVNANGLKDHDPINWTAIERAREILKDETSRRVKSTKETK